LYPHKSENAPPKAPDPAQATTHTADVI